ncbi:ATP-binding protein [Spirochaetota bacterium]
METYIPRTFKAPNHSFFLLGPRGTGKSTLLKNTYKNAMWIDLLKPDVFRTYISHPERIIELVHGNPDIKIIIIDEVQKAPELLSSVHSIIEEKKNLQFILTGSSARKLRRTGIDLLAGRVLLYSLFPFIASELKGNFDLEKALQYGLLPIIVSSDDPGETIKTYVALYIQEEVLAEGLVRNIGNFSRFLESISFSHGSVLNISNVARDCEVERKVVEGYVKILEDILLAFRIPVFEKKAKRKLSSHPKFYFFDTGVFQTLRPKGPLDKPEEIGGAALEGLVFQNLMAWNAYNGSKYTVYYWRTRNGLEIDFILYGKPGIVAFEVKNSKKIRPVDLKPLLSFKEDYPSAKCVLLYRGKERLIKKNIICEPCEDFLLKLKTGKKLA